MIFFRVLLAGILLSFLAIQANTPLEMNSLWKKALEKIPIALEVTYLRKDPDVWVRTSTQSYPVAELDYPNNPDYPDIELDTAPFAPIKY